MPLTADHKNSFRLSLRFRPLIDSKLTLPELARIDGAGERFEVATDGVEGASKAFASLHRCPPHGSFVPKGDIG